MDEFLIDPSQIQSQENIPLNNDDIRYIEAEQKVFAKIVPIVLACSSLFTMTFIAFCIKYDFSNFKYYDYIIFASAGFALFGFCYLIAWLVKRNDNNNWKQDKLNGKVKLTSVIVDRDKTEYGEYLTFAGQNEKIRIQVKQEDYNQYKIGTKTIVTYLKYSKKALDIREC